MDDQRFFYVGALGAALIVVSSLLLAVTLQDNGIGSGDTGRIFLGFLGFGTLVSGIGIVIARASAYLRR